MVKIAHLNNAFSESFNWQQAQKKIIYNTCPRKHFETAMLVEREVCWHVAKTFLSRLELIWLISRLQNSKMSPQKMHSWQKALRVNGLKYSVKSYYQLQWCQILQTSSGLKRSILHSSRMSRFSFQQVTFHLHLPNGQRLRQAISKLIKITMKVNKDFPRASLNLGFIWTLLLGKWKLVWKIVHSSENWGNYSYQEVWKIKC